MTRFGVLLILLTVTGCDTGPSRQQVLAALVGRSEADAIRTLGAPSREFDANGHKFLAYYDSNVSYVPTPFFGGPFYGGYFGPVTYPVVSQCETTLDIVDGRVATYTLRGGSC